MRPAFLLIFVLLFSFHYLALSFVLLAAVLDVPACLTGLCRPVLLFLLNPRVVARSPRPTPPTPTPPASPPCRLIAAPEGIHRICKQFPRVKVITSEIDECMHDLHVVPGVGEFGDRWVGGEAARRSLT